MTTDDIGMGLEELSINDDDEENPDEWTEADKAIVTPSVELIKASSRIYYFLSPLIFSYHQF